MQLVFPIPQAISGFMSQDYRPMSRDHRPSGQFPPEVHEWIIGYFTRITGVLAPLVALLLLYRWKVGLLGQSLGFLGLVLVPLALLPVIAKWLGPRGREAILLGVFVIATCVTLSASGIEGIGPLLSLLAAFSAFLFFGNFSFWLVSGLVLALIWASALARVNGLVVPTLDLDVPINVFGRALTLTLILGTLLAVLRGIIVLLADQRALAARNQARSERALSELNLFIDSANAPIFGIDTNGAINEWNVQAASITGVSRSEALGKNLVEMYIADEYKASVAGVLERALAGTNTANFEFPLYSQSGGRVEILLNATTRHNTEGTVIGVMGVGQDITRFREQERELHQAQKMKAVGLLTGGIAHDFNNLLTVISGNLELAAAEIAEGEEAPGIEEALSDATSAARDGAYLTSQLLTFAAPQLLSLHDFNLQTVIGNVVRKVAASLPSGIECSVDVEDDGIRVMADRILLENCILNLVSNASAAIQNGGSISVKCHKEQLLTSQQAAKHGVSVGEYIVISVSDDGCGIPEHSLDRVKDPFFTTKGIGKGAGLGLSMVDNLATQLGGALRIQSTVGIGTLVTLVIPLIRSQVGTPIEKPKTRQQISRREETRRVLVVEDEARIRKIAVRHLVASGFRCIEAGDASQALEILAAQAEGEDIDILFSDIKMPGDMTGRELAAVATRLYPMIKIALTTGFEEDAPHNPEMAGTHAGTANLPVLRKPYLRESLIDLMSEL